MTLNRTLLLLHVNALLTLCYIIEQDVIFDILVVELSDSDG